MRKQIITIIAAAAIILITQTMFGCKNTYTDTNVRNYQLDDICVKSHMQANYQWTKIGDQYYYMYMGDIEVCDESRTNIVYINN